jgi:LysR family nitrogen assimilation transcriptional regulator
MSANTGTPVAAVLYTERIGERSSSGVPFDPPLVRTVYLAPPTDRPLTHAAQAIERLCRTTLADLVRSGIWRSGKMQVTT